MSDAPIVRTPFRPEITAAFNDPNAIGPDGIGALTPEQRAADKAALDKYVADELVIRTRVARAEAAEAKEKREKEARKIAKQTAAEADAAEKAQWHKDVAERKLLADIAKARTSIADGVSVVTALRPSDLARCPALIRAIRVDLELALATLPPS